MVWGHPVTTDTPSVSLHSCPSQTFPGPHSAHKCFSPSSLVPRRVFLSPPSLAPQKSCPGRSHHFEPAGGSNGMWGGSGGPRSLASHRDLGVPTYPLDGDSCRALQQPLSQPQPEASARSQGCHRWREVSHSPVLQMGTMLGERIRGKDKPQPSSPWGSLGRSVSIFPPFPSLTSSAHPKKG